MSASTHRRGCPSADSTMQLVGWLRGSQHSGSKTFPHRLLNGTGFSSRWERPSIRSKPPHTRLPLSLVTPLLSPSGTGKPLSLSLPEACLPLPSSIVPNVKAPDGGGFSPGKLRKWLIWLLIKGLQRTALEHRQRGVGGGRSPHGCSKGSRYRESSSSAQVLQTLCLKAKMRRAAECGLFITGGRRGA